MNFLEQPDLETLKTDLLNMSEAELLNVPMQSFTKIETPELIPPLSQPSPFYRFRQIQLLDCPLEKCFEFFSEAKNLENITPDILNFKILSQSTPEITEGSEFVYRLKVKGLPMKWRTKITKWNPPFQFVDYQMSGPYRVWFHTHSFSQYGEKTLMIDEVKYILPFGLFGKMFAAKMVEKDVKHIFNHRYYIIKEMLE
ncbi:MAG: CDP-paratose 2-epimerase [Halobacteriovoraceae bacterium]|nr:CDP-paratose 2-epimerase [Halobacteriovoraceae bacterium]|tara:strand:- start:1941 stop:2534 length:594 start_codon:yes stop_codon:yes gene_type:complete